jgi:predicted nucleic acid-binding Zn ribbon protein
MSKKIHRIGKVLQKTLRRMDLQVKLEGYRVWLFWHDIVGEQIAKRTQPERLTNGILFVRVSSSTWMQQLQTMKPILLEKIRGRVKDAVIEDIRFRLGKVTPSRAASPTPKGADEGPSVSLNSDMETYLGRIGDEELRTLMRNIMLKQMDRGT